MSGYKNVYGLHSFENPQDAFEVICSNWGSNTEEMAILDDYRFSQVIIERAIKAIVEFYIDRRDQKWLEDSFGINDVITGYLTNFDFFYYSLWCIAQYLQVSENKVFHNRTIDYLLLFL